MKKSIYSLVLADEVVAAADRMAYELHTSRSNLINQILAEHLSCITPEMRMQAVFSGMEELAEQFRMLEQTSAHIRALQSRLNYKYKPTVQYAVELYRMQADGADGCIKVQLRTQNAALITILEQFFRLWIKLEERHVPAAKGIVYRMAPGRLERSIRNPGVKETELGELIGSYIQRFDFYLKAWFAGISEPQSTAKQLDDAFRKEMQTIKQTI